LSVETRAEILAPAGGFEALRAAVRCGADAVYFGGKTLNARRNTGNFGNEELAEAVRYCHARGARTYITLNTLVYDGEIKQALKLIESACAFGADALILQDLGLAKLAREAAPGMPLHASTQMSVQTHAGLETLAELGFSRAILPRELSRKEIETLAESPPLELEMFVHGALCMSVSGQCYLSAVLGSRSGNRGLCAGPCRLPFSAGNGPGYDLSLKDLSLVDRLRELESLGVRSFKIEGRMKRPEYVAAAVTACRKALDGDFSPGLADDLKAVFSRSGFTAGYYDGRRGRDMFGIRGKDDVTAAAPVLAGFAKLYERETPLVPVDFVFECESGKPMALTAGANGKSARALSPDLPEKAVTWQLTPQSVTELLSKCGGTPFAPAGMDIRLGENLNAPASAINALRREVLTQLEMLLGDPLPVTFRPTETELPADRPAGEPVIYARFRSLPQIPAGSADKILRVYLPLSAPDDDLRALAEMAVQPGVELPRGIFGGEQAVRERLARAKDAGIRCALAGTLDGMALASDAGFDVCAGLGSNVFNSHTLALLRGLGVSETVLSFELTLRRAASLRGEMRRGLMVYGRLPLMLMRNCPSAAAGCGACGGNGRLTDRLGTVFPVVCESGCAEVLNSRPLYMADRLAEIGNTDFHMLYFTTETQAECADILGAYAGGDTASGEFTRGLYYRGVL